VTLTEEEWASHFRDIPPTFYRLLAEILGEVAAEREREMGIERRGRRPALTVGSIDDVVNVVYPRRSTLPFAEALRGASKQTCSTIAKLAGINPGNLFRMMHGTEPLTKAKIEVIARVVHVNPAYFHEYRVLAIHEAIDGLLSPHRSIQAFATIEADTYAYTPSTPNAAAGYGMSAGKRQTFATRAKRVTP